MANLSDAFGTVRITARNLEVLNRIIEAQAKSEEKVEYDTTLGDTLGAHMNLSGDGMTKILEFTATGRWNFENNMNWFISSILEADPTLEEEMFQARFEVCDAEFGCDFVLKATGMTSWNPSMEKPTTEYTVLKEDDYTVKNLEAYGFDTSEMVDGETLLEDFDKALLLLEEYVDNNPDKEEAVAMLENQDLYQKFLEEEAGVYCDFEEFLDFSL